MLKVPQSKGIWIVKYTYNFQREGLSLESECFMCTADRLRLCALIPPGLLSGTVCRVLY